MEVCHEGPYKFLVLGSLASGSILGARYSYAETLSAFSMLCYLRHSAQSLEAQLNNKLVTSLEI